MTRLDTIEEIFRVLEEDIRSAGERDMAVPDIMSGAVPHLTEITQESIKHYIQSYQSWLEPAVEMLEGGFRSNEDMMITLVAMRGILNLCLYYTERLQAAVSRDRDVPWETRVAMDLMLTAFGEQLGAQ